MIHSVRCLRHVFDFGHVFGAHEVVELLEGGDEVVAAIGAGGGTDEVTMPAELLDILSNLALGCSIHVNSFDQIMAGNRIGATPVSIKHAEYCADKVVFVLVVVQIKRSVIFRHNLIAADAFASALQFWATCFAGL